MAFRIVKSQSSLIKPPKPVKRKEYLDFIRQLPCAVTGVMGVEAAHLSTRNVVFGHLGRGKSQKASDRWALPLSPAEHRAQHDMNEADYWTQRNIHPWELACVLYGIWADLGDDGIQPAIEAINWRIKN